MASWIVHLRIAEKLLEDIPDLDPVMFAIGNIAPDSGLPDENWENFEPPVKVTHFTPRHEGDLVCEDMRFYREYLTGVERKEDPGRYSFLLGYFFHLVTDNYWSLEIGKPTQERFAAEFAADDQFIWEVKKDWYGLDFIYVRDHPQSIFWQVFLKSEIDESCLEFLPLEAIHHRIDYIKEFYQRQDEKISALYQRPYTYLSKAAMDRFVADVSAHILEIHHFLANPRQDYADYISVLDLPRSAA